MTNSRVTSTSSWPQPRVAAQTELQVRALRSLPPGAAAVLGAARGLAVALAVAAGPNALLRGACGGVSPSSIIRVCASGKTPGKSTSRFFSPQSVDAAHRWNGCPFGVGHDVRQLPAAPRTIVTMLLALGLTASAELFTAPKIVAQFGRQNPARYFGIVEHNSSLVVYARTGHFPHADPNPRTLLWTGCDHNLGGMAQGV